MDPLMLKAFLGWCVVINFGFLTFWWLMVSAGGSLILPLHGRMFGMTESEVRQMHYWLMGGFKLLVVAINVTPWIALSVLSQ